MLALRENDDGELDLVRDKDGYLRETTLRTPILIALHTDKRVNDRRGCWYDPDLGTSLWSLLGDVSRATRQRAESEIRSAAQWAVDEGLIRSVDVSASVSGQTLSAEMRIIGWDSDEVIRVLGGADNA